MAEPHLDHPDDISWYVGHGPAPILGDCPHVYCQHRDTVTVAWGPDFEHYELVICIETGEDGAERCAGACRGWHAEYPSDQVPDKMPQHRWHGFRQFDPTGEHRTTREERQAADDQIATDRAAERAAR